MRLPLFLETERERDTWIGIWIFRLVFFASISLSLASAALDVRFEYHIDTSVEIVYLALQGMLQSSVIDTNEYKFW